MSLESDVPQSESSESDLISRLTRSVDPGDANRVSQPAAPAHQPSAEEATVEEDQYQENADGADDVQEGQVETQDNDGGLVELEHLGKKYQVPPSLKTAFEANRAQANRIPQEITEMRKMLNLEKQAVEAKRAFEQQAKPEFDELSQLEAQIAQFKNIDWASMDTDQLVRARQALDVIKDKRDDLKQTIQKKRGEFDRALSGHMEQVKQRGEAYLQKAIPGWGQDVATEVAKFAISKGFTQDELSALYDPRTVHVLWDAMQYQKLQASKPQVLNKARQAPPVSKPGAVDQTNSSGGNKERVYRDRLRKSGSIEDAAQWLLARNKSR